MKKSVLLFNALLIVLSIQSINAQGPWAKGKGHGYGQLLFNFIPTYNEVFDADISDDAIQIEREISDVTFQPYLELGVSNKFTIGGSVPIISVSTGDATEGITPTLPEGNLTSLGNVNLWGKYTLVDKKLKLAFIADFALPTSTRDDVSGLSTGVNAFTFQPKLSLGGSKNKFYYYGFFGYGLRNNDYHDFLNFGIEGGYQVGKKLTLILNLSSLQSLENGSDSVDSVANVKTGLYTSYQQYTAFLFKVFAEDLYKNIGAFASVGGGGFGARSVAASPAISLGVFYKW